MGFPEQLKKLREAKGLTKKALALQADISCTLLTQYEQGVYNPSLPRLINLADVLHVSLDELAGRTQEY